MGIRISRQCWDYKQFRIWNCGTTLCFLVVKSLLWHKLLLINQMVIKNSLNLKQSKEYVILCHTWILFLNSLCNENLQVKFRKIKLGMVVQQNKRNPVGEKHFPWTPYFCSTWNIFWFIFKTIFTKFAKQNLVPYMLFIPKQSTKSMEMKTCSKGKKWNLSWVIYTNLLEACHAVLIPLYHLFC